MFFSSSFRCCYLTIDLVRSPIVGCEGTGVGRLYSHRRQHMGRFSNVVLGTRSFTEGNIKGHRGTTIFYRGSLLKRPCSRDMTIFRKATKWDYPKGASVQVCLIYMYLVLIRVIYLLISCLVIQTLITSIYI